MKKFFSFSFTSYSLFPILAGIFYVIRSFCFYFFSDRNNYKSSLIFQIVLLEFGMFLSFILEIINIYRQSTDKNEFKTVIKKWFEKYKEKKILFAMLSCAFFDCIGIFLTNLIVIDNSQNKNQQNQHLSS